MNFEMLGETVESKYERWVLNHQYSRPKTKSLNERVDALEAQVKDYIDRVQNLEHKVQELSTIIISVQRTASLFSPLGSRF